MMRKERPKEAEGAVLTDAMQERLLRRASELDVAERTSAKLAQLRDAAMEAGISPAAFDAALAEMREPAAVAVATEKPIRWSRAVAFVVGGVAAVVLAFSTLFVGRAVAPAPTVATVEQILQLKCLTPARAAVLIRSALPGQSIRIAINERSAPNAIAVYAPLHRMEAIRTLIAKNDQVGPAGCVITPQN